MGWDWWLGSISFVGKTLALHCCALHFLHFLHLSHFPPSLPPLFPHIRSRSGSCHTQHITLQHFPIPSSSHPSPFFPSSYISSLSLSQYFLSHLFGIQVFLAFALCLYGMGVETVRVEQSARLFYYLYLFLPFSLFIGIGD